MSIDLDGDLGKSFGAWKMGDDVAVFDVVGSADVACGFDVGDSADTLKALRAAAERIVAIAQRLCAFPERAGLAALPFTAAA
ncbi:LamB/YcsF family protein [Microvirga sp. TS319]|uniref:LamB/YcsF family protein n=1 Tax=Microvirga sp. TS319 TaxID=3241165 RepID=UPI003519E2D8